MLNIAILIVIHVAIHIYTLTEYGILRTILHGVLVIILSFIFTCPAPYNKYKLLSTARSYPLGSDHIFFTPQDIFPVTLNFNTRISNFMFHKSTHVLIFL
jgi:hypothetical protein